MVGSDFEISRTCGKYRGHCELARTCKIAGVAPRDADTPEAVSLRSECSGFILQDQIVKLYKTDFEGDTSCDFCHHSELARTKFVLAISILFQEHTKLCLLRLESYSKHHRNILYELQPFIRKRDCCISSKITKYRGHKLTRTRCPR